jgi:23S rRNA (adenine2503-C2)-methyltransferase
MGFRRHLSPAEMVAQVLYLVRASGATRGQKGKLKVVFMGMGEPLHNIEAVLTTHEILTDQQGMGLSERDVAVSTSGLVSKIERLARYRHRPQLMVSIAATTDEARSALMPVNRAWPLAQLTGCLETFPLRKREKILLGYVVIAGNNDTDEDAIRLAAMARRFPSLVNLIPMNPHVDAQGMNAPEETSLQRFYRILLNEGAFATIRRSRGQDVAGACGQLVRRYRAGRASGREILG